jgi:hypothetical protein
MDGPVVIALEDLHWADATSLQLLERLIGDTETSALLLVLTSRSERDHASWRVKEDAARQLPQRAAAGSAVPLAGMGEAGPRPAGLPRRPRLPVRPADRGRNLAPGEWFSFWGSVGPITEERGFTYGGAIINGRSTQGVAIGGGICSTSTTIFNAALRAGLEMGIRANHHYYIDRYPDGLDATVSIIDGWEQDMTFRNDTEHPIVIRGFGGNGFVTFQIWSAPTGRTVVITDPVTSNHRSAIETTQVSSSLAPGTSKRIEYPHDGHDVSRSRSVYDANGNQIHRTDYFSHYATVNGLTLVGPSS